MSVPKGYRFGPPLSRRGGRKASSGLTKHQMRVLAAIGDGLATKEIADKMKTSAKTVEFHRRKLNTIFPRCASPVKLARIAIAFGMSSLCLLLVACRATTPVTPPPPPVAASPRALATIKPLAKPQKSTSVTMAWNSVSGATNYILLWGLSTSYNNARATPFTQTRITGLNVGSVYHFAVLCQRDGKQSYPSADVAWKAINWPGNGPAPLP